MISENGKRINLNGFNKTSHEVFEEIRKDTGTYSIIALLCLIASIILISFDQKLLAGCMVIAAASLGILIMRKHSHLNKIFKDSVSEFSSLNERKDDVITDFSHKIREPLNNLVIITDMLMEFDVENTELLLMKDSQLYEEYVQLSRKKKKQLMFVYIRKFNEKNPLYIPVEQ